jgi:transposase
MSDIPLLIEPVTRLIESVNAATGGVKMLTIREHRYPFLEKVGDWNRFKNRRQVAGYTGLIPSENSSGEGHKQGSVTKHGNPRVRHLLVEAVWRLLQFQPDYKPIKRLLPILRDCKLRGQSARRRKLIVALARLFAIDWWRIRTGRVNPADLGLQMSWPSAAVLRNLNPDAQAATAS